MESHIRIDEGVKRGKRKARVKPSDLEREARRQARNGKGNFLPVVSPEQRQSILEDALVMLEQGFTTNDIGAKHKVAGSTIRSWLVASGDEANQARTLFYSRIQVEFADQIPLARDPLSLARAREGFNAWHKLAQVRDPKHFGPKQEITHSVSPVLHIHSAVAPQHLESVITSNPLPSQSVALEPQPALPSPSGLKGGDVSQD